jgi:hypothetical protein
MNAGVCASSNTTRNLGSARQHPGVLTLGASQGNKCDGMLARPFALQGWPCIVQQAVPFRRPRALTAQTPITQPDCCAHWLEIVTHTLNLEQKGCGTGVAVALLSH